MIHEVVGTTDGAASFAQRYCPSRQITVWVIEACNRSNNGYVTLAIGQRGAPVESLVAIKQGSTLAAGFGLQWTGELPIGPDEELVAVWTNAAASEIVDLSLYATARGGQ